MNWNGNIYKYELYCIIMIEYETKLKSWGNSFGIVVPKEKVKEEKLKDKQTVKVIITPKKTVKVKDLFGKLKFKKSTEQMMREIDRELDSKF